MTKVLLIQPNYNIDRLGEEGATMPLALVELATFIKEKGHEPKILDRNLDYDNDGLIKMLHDFEPDIVGMTCYTSPVIKDIMQISEIVKKNSKALVIVGGVHATLAPDTLLDFPHIDYVVRGEGEYPLLDICELIDKGKANKKNMLKIENVNYNKMRGFINPDDIPAPDYDLLEVRRYGIAIFCTSRGCPGRCKFCYNLGRQLRFYNTDKVIKTINHVLGKYKIKEFTIADDNFANLSKRCVDICNVLERYKGIFHIFLRVDQTDEKVLKNLKKAGCWAIQFGFESGNQRILDFIGKGITVKDNLEAVKKCKKLGIFVDGSFMMGLPTETANEMKQTADFIKKSKIDAPNVKVFKPYPSTELYDYAVKEGILSPPKTLQEWAEYGDLTEGNPNVSEIPTYLLLKTVNELNTKQSNLMYAKKALLLILRGHIRYALNKIKSTVKSKLRRLL